MPRDRYRFPTVCPDELRYRNGVITLGEKALPSGEIALAASKSDGTALVIFRAPSRTRYFWEMWHGGFTPESDAADAIVRRLHREGSAEQWPFEVESRRERKNREHLR